MYNNPKEIINFTSELKALKEAVFPFPDSHGNSHSAKALQQSGFDFGGIDFCCRVEGDDFRRSGIHAGDFVFFRAQTDFHNGDLVAVAVDFKFYLLRAYFYPEQLTLCLRSDDAFTIPFVFHGDEIADVTVLGKALYCLAAIPNDVSKK